jgi:hypothetical protein
MKENVTVKFKIIEVHEDEHAVTVRYFTDAITELMLATTISPDGKVTRARYDRFIRLPYPCPDEAGIDAIISQFSPQIEFTMKENILDPAVDTTMPVVHALVGVEKEIVITSDPETKIPVSRISISPQVLK